MSQASRYDGTVASADTSPGWDGACHGPMGSRSGESVQGRLIKKTATSDRKRARVEKKAKGAKLLAL